MSESQKAAARLSDYDGDASSEPYTSGSIDPAVAESDAQTPPYTAVESPQQVAAADEAMQRAENERD